MGRTVSPRLPFMMIMVLLLVALGSLAWLGYYHIDRKAGMIESAAPASYLDGYVITIESPAAMAPAASAGDCGDTSFSLASRTLGIWPLLLQEGDAVIGSFRVDGGGKEGVGFRVSSPTYESLVPEGEHSNELQFSVKAPIQGEYNFLFDNWHSSVPEKRVSLQLCIQ